MPAHVTLLIDSGPANVGQSITFDRPAKCLVGRDASCGLRLDDPRDPPHVSRKHCELIVEPPSVLVRDLDSPYGTTITGRLRGCRAPPAMARGRLFDGDTLGVADHQLRVSPSPLLCSACLQAIHGESARR